MMTNREMEIYDYMVETEIATAEELNLVKSVMHGNWEEILNAVLYARTEYRTLEQMFEDEDF